jgi:purine-binding chemotaxis protein CheW
MDNTDHTPLPADSASHNLAVFRLDRLNYALPIEVVQQIIEMVTITPLLGVSSSVAGSINVRGAAVPVINLRRHLKLPEAKLLLHTPIILVQTGEWMVGLIVDEVTSVLAYQEDQLTNPLDKLPAGLGETTLLRGLLNTAQGPVILLNLKSLFAHDSARIVAALQTVPDLELAAGNGHTAPLETVSPNGQQELLT